MGPEDKRQEKKLIAIRRETVAAKGGATKKATKKKATAKKSATKKATKKKAPAKKAAAKKKSTAPAAGTDGGEGRPATEEAPQP